MCHLGEASTLVRIVVNLLDLSNSTMKSRTAQGLDGVLGGWKRPRSLSCYALEQAYTLQAVHRPALWLVCKATNRDKELGIGP